MNPAGQGTVGCLLLTAAVLVVLVALPAAVQAAHAGNVNGATLLLIGVAALVCTAGYHGLFDRVDR